MSGLKIINTVEREESLAEPSERFFARVESQKIWFRRWRSE
jgi:hypothetical protein